MARIKLVVEVRGGVVCGVFADNGDVDVEVFDWDDKWDGAEVAGSKAAHIEGEYDKLTSDLLQVY